MDKLFDFEFWDRGSIPTRGDSFVLYSILSFFYMKLVLYVSIDNNINCDKCVTEVGFQNMRNDYTSAGFINLFHDE